MSRIDDNMKIVRRLWQEWKIGSWLFGFGSALIVVIAFTFAFAYAAPNSWDITGMIRSQLPLPMVTAGWSDAASFRDVATDLASVRRFYESQDFSTVGLRVDFTTEDGKKRLKIREREIINRALENDAIARAAARDGIRISDADAQKAVADQLSMQGNDPNAVKDRLMKLYGWTIPEFTGKVVRPALFEEALRKRFEADTTNFVEAKKKAEMARKRLDDGRSFADAATEFSEGKTAGNGGDMGWFPYADLAASLQDAAKNQKIGVPGDVIESDLGFHILLINERKTENGKDLVELSQIFVKKKTFGDWLTSELQGMSIHVLAPEYEWNQDTARVEFHDPALRQFEANLLQNSQGDASVIF